MHYGETGTDHQSSRERERERERESTMLARSVEWPWCVALMVYLLSWLICFRSHQKETASVTTMTRVKGHLLLQIKISVVQVGRDDSDNGEGCIVHHWKTIHSHICTTSCECLFRAKHREFPTIWKTLVLWLRTNMLSFGAQMLKSNRHHICKISKKPNITLQEAIQKRKIPKACFDWKIQRKHFNALQEDIK